MLKLPCSLASESSVCYAKRNEVKLLSFTKGLFKHKTLRRPRSEKLEKALYLWVQDMQKKSTYCHPALKGESKGFGENN